MAIKGKKKSQARGSQGQRRPAAAPRPAYTGPRRVPWYRTTLGRYVAIGLGSLAIIALFVVVARAQNASQERAEQQAALQEFTGDLGALAKSLDGPVSKMIAAPSSVEDERIGGLEKDARNWTTSLQGAQAQASQLTPPEGAANVSTIFQQAINLYVTSAQTFALAPAVEGNPQAELLLRAGELRDNAGVLWETAIAALDIERQEADMDPSGITIPGATATPAPAPTGALPTGLPTSLEELEQLQGGQGGGGGTKGSKGAGSKRGGGGKNAGD